MGGPGAQKRELFNTPFIINVPFTTGSSTLYLLLSSYPLNVFIEINHFVLKRKIIVNSDDGPVPDDPD